MKRALLDALLDVRANRVPAALVTDLETGAQALVTAEAVAGDLRLTAAEQEAVSALMRTESGGVLDAAPGVRPLFVDVHAPPPRLIVVGAVHIAQYLVPMAAMTGYDVYLVDPREAFAVPERFPDVTISHEWPDDALAEIGLDAGTAVVTLTHDPKLDDPALHTALRAPVFYVGALGSKKTHAKRVARLREHGLTADEVNRLHAPIGLPIGAKSPAEIAVSILAEITARRRGAAP